MSYNNNLWKAEPKRKEYETFEDRLATFQNWPVEFISAEELAKAGLWYTGEKDRVRCYFCGGGLRDWVVNDIPIKEHKKLFPDCGFLEQISRSKTLIQPEQSKSRL